MPCSVTVVERSPVCSLAHVAVTKHRDQSFPCYAHFNFAAITFGNLQSKQIYSYERELRCLPYRSLHLQCSKDGQSIVCQAQHTASVSLPHWYTSSALVRVVAASETAGLAFPSSAEEFCGVPAATLAICRGVSNECAFVPTAFGEC